MKKEIRHKTKAQQLLDYWQTRALTAEGDFGKLQIAVLNYFNLYCIHPYTAGLDDVWPPAKIRVNKKKDGWELAKESMCGECRNVVYGCKNCGENKQHFEKGA